MSEEEHLSDFVSSDIEEETQTTPKVSNTPRRKLTEKEQKNRAKERNALHKKFADSAPQVRIPTRAEVKNLLENNLHPFQDYEEDEGGPRFFNGWDQTIVTRNMVLATAAGYQNKFNKGKPTRAKQTRVGASNSTHSINHLCSLNKHCSYILNATPSLLYHQGSDEPYNHTWSIKKFHHHTCNKKALLRQGVSNCAYTSKELAYAIQNETQQDIHCNSW